VLYRKTSHILTKREVHVDKTQSYFSKDKAFTVRMDMDFHFLCQGGYHWKNDCFLLHSDHSVELKE